MKALLFCAVLVSGTMALAQSELETDALPTEEQWTPEPVVADEPLRLDYSSREFETFDFRPLPVTVFDPDNGFRTYNSQAEADAGEAKIREDREAMERGFEEQNRYWDAVNQKRRDDAGWKLLAVGAGLLFGFLRILWGLATGSND